MKKLPELYACLYVPEFPVQALLRLRGDIRGRGCAVLEGEPPLQHVCSCNEAAYGAGIECGMTRVELETFESVIILKRSRAEEEVAKNVLLECAEGFSPSIADRNEDGCFLCVIDIAGTEKLHGPPSVLGKALFSRVQSLGFVCSVAIASNFHAGICLAHSLAPGQLRVVPPNGERDALAPLPLSVLDLTKEQRETFSLWGINTLGSLAALPAKSLIARMGQDGCRLRQLAQGMLPHLFVPIEPSFLLEEFMELDSPVEALESLLFVMSAMLEQLIARAANRALALRSVTILLFLEGGDPHSRTVRPALPSSDRQLWIKLIHLDLEAHPPGAAILSLRLTAEPGYTSKVQLGLFTPQLPDATRLDVTLARIRAIVGEDAVGSPVLSDTHRPDSCTLQPFRIDPGEGSRSSSPQSLTALRQLRPPEDVSITLQHQRPISFFFRQRRYDVERSYGPWLAGGEWWGNARWGFQQWDLIARSQVGETLCCCLAHDLVGKRWQMTGLYD
jgi:protein ImuB